MSCATTALLIISTLILFLKMAKEADKEKDFPKLPLEQVNDNE
jgi:hypothetical protein